MTIEERVYPPISIRIIGGVYLGEGVWQIISHCDECGCLVGDIGRHEQHHHEIDLLLGKVRG